MWAALRTSGVDPVAAGLAIGLAAPAYTPARGELEDATVLVRRFREQPTPEFARSAQAGLVSVLSPNERLQTFYHPWTSYVIVPLFALANAGIVVNARVPGPGVRGAGHARRADRLRGRQADRRDRQFLGRHPAQPRADPPADRGRRGGRQWHHRRDRLHGGAADRHARVPGCGTGRGQARRAVGRVRGRPADLGRAQRGPPASRPTAARVSCSATPG